MVLLGNPVPTSGQIRDTRRRLAAGLTPLARLAGADQAQPFRVMTDPQVRSIWDSLLAAGRAGVTALEQASDDAHDAVEERLARLHGWHPRHR